MVQRLTENSYQTVLEKMSEKLLYQNVFRKV